MNRFTYVTASLLAAALLLGGTRTAQAQQQDDFSDRSLTLGLRGGIYLPGLFTEMSAHADLSFELGYMLPFADKRLAIVADASYAPPGASGAEVDPRIGADGGSYSYDMTSQQLFVSLGPLFRFLVPGKTFVPYLGAFARLYMLRTTVNGAGNGEPFGENTEESTEFGFAVAAGGELRAGPGAVLLDVSFGWAPLPHRITGDVHASALAVQLGYRLFL